MGLIEDELRATFVARVRQPPAIEDVAGRAMRGAGRVRRRRVAVAAFTAATCVLLVAAVAALTSGPGVNRFAPTALSPEPSASSSSAIANLPLAVLDDDHLELPGHSTIDLGGLRPLRAWQTSDGWLLETSQATTASLWYLPPAGGTPVKVVEGQGVLVAPDGRQVAWGVSTGRVSVATRTGAVLTGRRETGGTGSRVPIAFADGGLLISGSDSGTAAATEDMWYPARGAFKKGPTYASRIFGSTVDGTRLFALSAGDHPCLTLLVPATFQAEHSTCDLQLNGILDVHPSPDGRWLALVYPERVEVYRSATVWTSPQPAQLWLTEGYGLAWTDGSSFLVSTGYDVAAYRVDAPGRQATYKIAVQPTAVSGSRHGVWPVPRLG